MELYLAAVAGESVELPAPASRWELYLAKILGQDVELPVPQSAADFYLAKIAGEDVELPAFPTTRSEEYLAEWAGGGEAEYVTVGPTALAAFVTLRSAPLKSLSIAIEPVQSGSGDPSPDNVRPISGWTEVKVWVEPTHDTTADPTVTVDLDGTRYGGTLDVLTGALTVMKKTALISDFSWSPQSSSGRDFFRTSNITEMENGSDCLTSNIPFVGGTSVASMPDGSMALIGQQFRLYDTSLTDKESLATKYGTGQICYELSAPQTVQLTPEQVSTLAGSNNVWADTGDVTLEYRAN